MQACGAYYQRNLGDRIAVLAVYMPLLRKEIFSFVENWNHHRLRKQNDTPNVVSGKTPNRLYYRAPEGCPDFKLTANQWIVGMLLEPVLEWGKQPSHAL
jgi:hypothetical protein